MKLKLVLSAGLGALALAAVASNAQAAPGGLGAIDRDAASGIEQVTWKRHKHCYWYRGYRPLPLGPPPLPRLWMAPSPLLWPLLVSEHPAAPALPGGRPRLGVAFRRGAASSLACFLRNRPTR